MSISKRAWIDPAAVVYGELEIADGVTVWPGAVIRADNGKIQLGEDTNVQDNAVLHNAVTLGRNVTVGHGAIVHGCTVEDNCLIGMGAIILTGAYIESGSIIAAGALVTQNKRIPAGSVVMGNPGRVARQIRPDETEMIAQNAAFYREKGAQTAKFRPGQ